MSEEKLNLDLIQKLRKQLKHEEEIKAYNKSQEVSINGDLLKSSVSRVKSSEDEEKELEDFQKRFGIETRTQEQIEKEILQGQLDLVEGQTITDDSKLDDISLAELDQELNPDSYNDIPRTTDIHVKYFDDLEDVPDPISVGTKVEKNQIGYPDIPRSSDMIPENLKQEIKMDSISSMGLENGNLNLNKGYKPVENRSLKLDVDLDVQDSNPMTLDTITKVDLGLDLGGEVRHEVERDEITIDDFQNLVEEDAISESKSDKDANLHIGEQRSRYKTILEARGSDKLLDEYYTKDETPVEPITLEIEIDDEPQKPKEEAKSISIEELLASSSQEKSDKIEEPIQKPTSVIETTIDVSDLDQELEESQINNETLKEDKKLDLDGLLEQAKGLVEERKSDKSRENLEIPSTLNKESTPKSTSNQEITNLIDRVESEFQDLNTSLFAEDMQLDTMEDAYEKLKEKVNSAQYKLDNKDVSTITGVVSDSVDKILDKNTTFEEKSKASQKAKEAKGLVEDLKQKQGDIPQDLEEILELDFDSIVFEPENTVEFKDKSEELKNEVIPASINFEDIHLTEEGTENHSKMGGMLGDIMEELELDLPTEETTEETSDFKEDLMLQLKNIREMALDTEESQINYIKANLKKILSEQDIKLGFVTDRKLLPEVISEIGKDNNLIIEDVLDNNGNIIPNKTLIAFKELDDVLLPRRKAYQDFINTLIEKSKELFSTGKTQRIAIRDENHIPILTESELEVVVKEIGIPYEILPNKKTLVLKGMI